MGQQCGLGLGPAVVANEDQGVTEASNSGVPAGIVLVERFLDPDIGLERRAAWNLEPSVHEDFSVWSIVIDINTRLAKVKDECSLGKSGSASESGGVVPEGQWSFAHAKMSGVSRENVVTVGDDTDRPQCDQSSDESRCCPRRDAPWVPRVESGNPFAEVPCQDRSGDEAEEIDIPDRLEGKVGERARQKQAEDTGPARTIRAKDRTPNPAPM